LGIDAENVRRSGDGLFLFVAFDFFQFFFLLGFFDGEVDHFDRPLNLNDGSDRIIGGTARSRDGLSPSEALFDESCARVHQMLEIIVAHGVPSDCFRNLATPYVVGVSNAPVGPRARASKAI
jgi:hypothetical protein